MELIELLLIEDNEGDILLTSEALSESNLPIRITVLKDGWEAMKFLDKSEGYHSAKNPDLVLLDINLPKINGIEVLKKIKSSQDLQHIPVIILTTSTSQEDISICYRNHANYYLSKPVDDGDYLKMVTSIEDFWASVVELQEKN